MRISTNQNRSLGVSVILGGIAATCNIVCSISIKENPQYIWPSLLWSGIFPIPLIFYRSQETKREGGKTQSISDIWAPFLLEVTAGCVHVVCIYFVLLFLELGDSIVLGWYFCLRKIGPVHLRNKIGQVKVETKNRAVTHTLDEPF